MNPMTHLILASLVFLATHYVSSTPLRDALVATAGTPGGALGNFAIATMLAAACSALSWHLIEKPALRAKPSRAPGDIEARALTNAAPQRAI